MHRAFLPYTCQRDFANSHGGRQGCDEAAEILRSEAPGSEAPAFDGKPGAGKAWHADHARFGGHRVQSIEFVVRCRCGCADQNRAEGEQFVVEDPPGFATARTAWRLRSPDDKLMAPERRAASLDYTKMNM